MEVDTLKDEFDRVVKKQKLASSRTIDLVNQIEKEIEQAIGAIQENGTDRDAASNLNHEILTDLKNTLKELVPVKQLESCQKEMNTALGKWVKTTEKFFINDISKAYKNVDMEQHVINEIIANHLYREALFDIGDNFLGEAGCLASIKLKQLFQEMYEIFGALRTEKSEPALSWAMKNHDALLQNDSCLELKLHQLQFVEILKQGKRDEALQYARTYLAPFATIHKDVIQKLIASILWAGRLDQSPYTEFLVPTNWEKLAEEFAQQFCNLKGQSSTGPMGMTVAAGAEVLPILLKLMMVLTAKREWHSMKEFPFPLDLRRDFQFHSVFICPVLREQGSDDNPPMLLPCGHVLSKQSTVKLSKSSSRSFKCPYCPFEALASESFAISFPVNGAMIFYHLPDNVKFSLTLAKSMKEM
ncbi:hypothetical protein ACQJBY_055029 [Aegilops geniculata]